MSMMGNFGQSAEEPEMKEQRRKNISAVLQRLSDKQSSGYESEKESDLYTQTPTEPRVPLIPECEQGEITVGEHSTNVTKTVRSYTEYEEVHVRRLKMKQEGWMKYQQEVIQQSSTSHSVCYPIPKQLPSSSACQSEHEQKQLCGSPAFVDVSPSERPSPPPKMHNTPSTQQYREPVIVPRQQSPFYRPHLWKSPTHGASYLKESDKTEQYQTSEERRHQMEAWSKQESKMSFDEPSRNIELFPPPECISMSQTEAEKGYMTVADTEKKEAASYPKSFKKYLQERYISSLKDTDVEGSPESVKSPSECVPGTPKKRLELVKAESERKNPSFSSTDSEGRGDVSLHSEVFIHVRDVEPSSSRRADEDESTETKDDVFEATEYLEPGRKAPVGSSQKARRRNEEPLDLRSKQMPSATFASHEELRNPAPFPTQLSPSMYHHSPPMFYSPQHEMMSPRSPLWSVPEGRVFNFNLPSPFESRCHSDPEFLSPGFSPDSPGLHFTFPPRSPYLGSGGEHSRMPKSPRLVYPGSPARFPGSSNKPLPKLFCSPPPVTEFQRQSDDAQGSELTYICPVCGQVFPSYDNLAKHMAKHLPTETVKTADNNKVHYCKVCNRAFSRSDMLTRHMRLHTGLKPYECRVCGQVFSRSDHLNTHQRTHTGEKPYRCPQCPYAACRRDMITRHMRIHLKRSSKRGKYLAVPEGESSNVRKSSVSSTDTTDSQEHSGRTCSVSSVDSVESEGGNRKCSATSGESFEAEAQPLSSGNRLWSSASAESTDFEESPHLRQSSSAFYADSPGPFLEPTFTYRKSRNWSTTSFESIDSEGSNSRRDSVADDFGDMDTKESTEHRSARDTPVIDDDSLRKFTISSDDIQN